MSRLLLTTLEYPPQTGGVASYYEGLLSAWPQEDSWSVLDNSQGELLAKGPLPWRKAFFSLYRKILKEKPNLVFVGHILPLGTVAYFLSFIIPFKYGLFFHGLDFSSALKTRRKAALSKKIIAKASVIVCANSKVEEMLSHSFPESKKKSVVVNPGAKAGEVNTSVKEALAREYEAQSRPIIFSMGRLVKRKGFDVVIKSLERIKDLNWQYLLAGAGPDEDYLRSLARNSSVSKRIHFLGKVSEEEKWSLLHLSDIFIMPSRQIKEDFEGFGIVYLEANLMSKPVIAGRSGGIGDAVIDGKNGLLVSPESEEEIAEAIKKLLSDRELALKLGREGKRRVEQEFAWPKISQNLQDYLKEKGLL